MKTLLLLRGAPGAGKSTFIKENNLEQYTLEADKFRTLISSPELDITGKFNITQHQDGKAWELLFLALENRMKNGDFTVVDATHNNPRMFSKYKALKEKYGYQVYYLDIKVSLEELLKRNKSRELLKQIPEEAVTRLHALVENTEPQNFAKKIESINEILNYITWDYSKEYNKVIVMGETRGCYEPLKELLNNNELDSKTKYIFTGNYFNKGLQNKEILEFIYKNHKNKNVTLLEGNYDKYFKMYASDNKSIDEIKQELSERFNKSEYSKSFVTNVLEDLLKYYTEEELKKKLRSIARKMILACPFEFHNHKYIVSHGGIPFVPNMTLIPGKQLIYGLGQDVEIDKEFEKNFLNNKTQGFSQIHSNYFTNSTEHSICLTDVDNIESGGNFKAIVLTSNQTESILIKNKMINPLAISSKFEEKEDVWWNETKNELTNEILKNKYIKIKNIKELNLYSLNFTSKAFYKKAWNSLTTKARGLYVDKDSGEVMMRSYNKFFNLNEVSETDEKKLHQTLEFPIKCYYKYNGFLGIASTINDEFILASKSVTYGDYKDYFQEIFDTLTEDEKNQFKELSKKYNCSFTFEVENIKDKHIIDFTENRLILLDAIPNSYEFNGIDIDREFSNKVISQIKITSQNLIKKELLAEFNSFEELKDYVRKHTNDRNIEGLVIEDSKGFMFKIKYNYYRSLKELRGVLFKVSSSYDTGIPYGAFRNEIQVKFAYWLAKNKTREEIKNSHIIELFKEYEEFQGKKVL